MLEIGLLREAQRFIERDEVCIAYLIWVIVYRMMLALY